MSLVLMSVCAFPLILIWTNALLLLAQRWRQHPSVSKYALLGLFGFALHWVAGREFDLWFAHGGSTWYTGGTVDARDCIDLLVAAVCWWLMMVAIFGWRGADSELVFPASVNPDSDGRVVP